MPKSLALIIENIISCNQNFFALIHFNKEIEIYPYHVEPWFNKGVIHKNRLEVFEMIECFKNVIEWGDQNDTFVCNAIFNKIAIESLSEGECLNLPMKTENYYGKNFERS